jgi:hypothetical protein
LGIRIRNPFFFLWIFGFVNTISFFYCEQFENWAKPSWEPEENLTGCQDAIDNFLLEEKVIDRLVDRF